MRFSTHPPALVLEFQERGSLYHNLHEVSIQCGPYIELKFLTFSASHHFRPKFHWVGMGRGKCTCTPQPPNLCIRTLNRELFYHCSYEWALLNGTVNVFQIEHPHWCLWEWQILNTPFYNALVLVLQNLPHCTVSKKLVWCL